MKVLFPLHLFYPSRVGGPANTIYWLCKALSKNGHEVTVVTTREGIHEGQVEIDRWVDLDGIKVRYCDSRSKFSLSIIRYALKVVKNVDTVVFSSICFLPNFFIAIAARLRGKKIVWSPRGELFDAAVHQGGIGKKLFFGLIRLLLGKYILFHATSEVEKDAISRYFPKAKVVIIPNYMEIPDKEDVESNYSNFIYVGRIAPIKALGKLIDGLAQSKSFRVSPYRFMIVGGVEKQFEEYYKGLLDQLDRLRLNEKIQFVGSLTGKDKFVAYAKARYSFLVSDSENFGNVVIEALSQGTPVVTSKGTPWEKLPQIKAGFWIDNTPQEIANTVDAIIQQPVDEYMQYRQNAFQFSKTFDVYEHVNEWENVIKLG